MRRIRRAVSFAGMSKKSQIKECGLKCASPEMGYYQPRSGYKSVANMSEKEHRRNSQSDVIDSADKNTSFYSSNYTSANYSSAYSSVAEGKDSDGWLGAKNYAMVPRMGRRASKEANSKYYKREGNSRSDNKKDYQDIYKDKNDIKPKAQTEKTRQLSVETGAVITTVPSVPSRKYSRDEDYASYDDLVEDSAPPRLAPVSGYLHQNAGKAVIRPIAFKPVVTAKPSMTSSYSNHSPDTYAYEKPHIDDGYASQESRSCSHNGTMRDCYIQYDVRPGSYDSNQYREHKTADCYQVTPSPTDNGAAHYEQLLQEKERELVILRETMEANERVIFQVNDEKRLNWENQMKELTNEYHRRLRLQQDRAFKAEQELKEQINKLQKDNQRMSSERDQLLMQKEHNSHLQEQLNSFRLKNDDLSTKLTNISCDCELLRQHDEEKEMKIQTLEELVTVIKAENMNLSNELDETRRISKKLERQDKTNPPSEREIQRLEQLLTDRDLSLRAEREQFVHDRESWEQEKKKVLQYQRQLQSNYIQMCKRNTELETSSYPQARSHNNNYSSADKHRHLKSQKCNFKAQLESTPESLC